MDSSSSFLFLLLFFNRSIESVTFTDGYRSSSSFDWNGNVNLILSAPHGGSLLPVDLPDRTSGGCRRPLGTNAQRCTWIYNDSCLDGQPCQATTVQDTLSDLFAENVANELQRGWNLRPFLVVGRWSRKKVDFNREVNEATFNHPEAITAHRSYHSALEQMIDRVNQTFGRALLIDIHGHSQGNYTMVGYLLTSSQLDRDDLCGPSFQTSIESLCQPDRNDCIRGRSSFGTFLESNDLGVSYPSLNNPKPGSRGFFSGGFITSNYISKINAIQTELPYATRAGANRAIFAKNYAQAIVEYMKANQLLRSQ